MPSPRRRKSTSASSPAVRRPTDVRLYPIGKPWHVRLASARETQRLGRILGQLTGGGDVLALFGDLGTGKTTLVRGLAEGIQAEPSTVSSPTFTLIQEYHGRLRLIHTDLYRLTAAQLEDTGLSEYLDDRSVAAIEWAERWIGGLPEDRLDIHLVHRTAETRQATLTARGPQAARLLSAVRARLTHPSPTRARRQTGVQLPRSRRTSR